MQIVGNFKFDNTIKWAFEKDFKIYDNLLKTNAFVRLWVNLRQIKTI